MKGNWRSDCSWGLVMAFLLMAALSVKSQDIHFSQPGSAPLYINPALAGFSNADLRINLNHRSQWRVVTKPYQTLSASIDAPIIKRKFQRDVFAIGLLMLGDKAGDSEYGTTQAELSLSYIKAIGRSNRLFLGIGLRGGYTQRSINYEKLHFDVQYNGFFFDPALPIGEQFTLNNLSFLDFAAGTNLFYQLGQEQSISMGYSLSHPGRPDISFMGDKSVRLPIKHTLYAVYEKEIAQRIYLQPSAYFFVQENFREILIGVSAKQVKYSNPAAYQAFHYGLYSRAVDAAVVYFGLDQRSIHLGFSYDVNYSRLRKGSHGFGGFEISLTWLLNKGKSNKIKSIPCPMF